MILQFHMQYIEMPGARGRTAPECTPPPHHDTTSWWDTESESFYQLFSKLIWGTEVK